GNDPPGPHHCGFGHLGPVRRRGADPRLADPRPGADGTAGRGTGPDRRPGHGDAPARPAGVRGADADPDGLSAEPDVVNAVRSVVRFSIGDPTGIRTRVFTVKG